MFKILSYNIHKGFNTFGNKYVLNEIRSSVEETGAEIVFLQEVLGHHQTWAEEGQFEFLADRMWTHYAYGKNAAYATGHHGNAVLSKFPIEKWENLDVSNNRYERRGMLHAKVVFPEIQKHLHAICVHFDLFEEGRRAQIEKLCDRIQSTIPPEHALIIAGDFNDWRQWISPYLYDRLNVKEAFLEMTGSHAESFPAFFPKLKLDRIYFRGLKPISATVYDQGKWRKLSDHLPLCAEFEFF